MTEHAQEMYRCTPRQAKAGAIRCLEAGLVPNLISSPGMGKSSIVREIGNEFNAHLIDERLSTRSPVDLAGFPNFSDGEASFVPFNTYPTIHTQKPKGKDGWILFFDEFNSGTKAVQAAAYKIVLDRMIGQTELHPDCLMVLAGNLMTDRAIVTQLSTAMQSRVIHFEMIISYREWLEDVALRYGYDERIIGYTSFKDGSLMDFKPDHTNATFNCPRTWEFMNKLVKGKPVLEEDTYLYAGTITPGHAVAFVQFCQVYRNLATLREILRDPDNARVPDDQPTRWAVVSSLLAKIDQQNFGDLAVYIGRFTTEFQTLFFRAALAKFPDLRTHPAFIKVAVDISRYLNQD